MRRTRPVDLLVPLVVVALILYSLLRLAYGVLPPLTYFAPVPLAALGLVELVLARRVRGAVRHEQHAKAMTAIAVARCVALGKASSVVGAIVVGAALALLARVLPDAGEVGAAAGDARVAALILATGLLVVVAGLLLERSGLDPNRDRRDPLGR